MTHDLSVDYRPRVPVCRRAIGVVGCGRVVSEWHLPAYRKHGLHVAGLYDVRPQASRHVQRLFGVETIYPGLDDMLADPRIDVVDVAVPPEGRVAIMRRAIAAGKHVLGQEPFAPTLAEAREVVAEAGRRQVQVAVNQNGRWAPPWRIATLLLERGLVGDIAAVTHLMDTSQAGVRGADLGQVAAATLFHHLIHWLDITRCWFRDVAAVSVRACSFQVAGEPDAAPAPWSMWVELVFRGGGTALIRSVGRTRNAAAGHPFWIHGTRGTIRGRVLGHDCVEAEADGIAHRYRFEGAWYPDGFAATMGELLCAVEEGCEPFNSARHNLLSLEMTLAAIESLRRGGAPIAMSPAVAA